MSIFARVLLSIIIFVVLTFSTSLLYEKLYFSRFRWLLFVFFGTSFILIFFERNEIQNLIGAFAGSSDISWVLVIAAGLISGIFISASCMIFRGVITAFKWIVGLFSKGK